MQPGKCRMCDAAVVFVRNGVTGNMMIVNPNPAENGNYVMIDRQAYQLSGDLFDGAIPEGPRYVVHQATCPATLNARKGKKEAKAK